MSAVRWRGPGSIGFRNRRGMCQSSFLVTQDEKTVGAGRKPAFDNKRDRPVSARPSFERRTCRETASICVNGKACREAPALRFSGFNRTGKGKADHVLAAEAPCETRRRRMIQARP